jgi:hypothetical protein
VENRIGYARTRTKVEATTVQNVIAPVDKIPQYSEYQLARSANHFAVYERAAWGISQ